LLIEEQNLVAWQENALHLDVKKNYAKEYVIQSFLKGYTSGSCVHESTVQT
jgi:hypothetical protein